MLSNYVINERQIKWKTEENQCSETRSY